MDNIKKIDSNTKLVISRRSKGVTIIKTDDSGNDVDIWLTLDQIKDIAKGLV